MIHSNHKKNEIVYYRDRDHYELYTECHCGAIYPIPVFMIAMDEMCSILKHNELKHK